MPKSIQEFQSRQDVSSKAITTPTVEAQPSKKKITFKEPKVMTTQSEREKVCQPKQEQGRGESKSSMTTPTYQEKGKAKAGSTNIHQFPRQLIQKSYARSSSANALPDKRQGKVYQPKYPSPRAQQRRQSRQVLVPKNMLEAQRLCKDDEHKWVERKAIESDHSSGWISTRRSLEAQSYNQGNRKLWLQKPEFIAYNVPSTMDLSTPDAERRQQRTQQQRRRKRRSKPRRRKPIG